MYAQSNVQSDTDTIGLIVFAAVLIIFFGRRPVKMQEVPAGVTHRRR
jgi:hypothetical protein